MTLLVNNMKTETDRKTSFLRFVNERENVRLRRAKGGPAPWTSDEILRDYHFCNVKRSDDRVTQWIGNWVAQWNKPNRWFACAVARWINEPETLEQLPTSWNPAVYKRTLDRMYVNGVKIFRAAYIINGTPGVKKYVSVVDTVLGSLAKDPPGNLPNSFEMCWRLMREYPGHGSFMAGQIAFDWHTFGIVKAVDALTWAPLGPGSIRGLNIIFMGNADAKKMSQDQGVLWLRELRTMVGEALPNVGKRLELMDIQNCCCEFNKYVRGYSKTKFVPHQEKFL
jgi:hypothetical protein